MKFIFRFPRLLYINYIILSYSLDELVLKGKLGFVLRILFFLLPSRLLKKNIPRGERLFLACEHLGPIFVKFGQLLSTRIDILPPDIAKELVKLQDKVKPFSGVMAIKIISSSYGKDIHEIFASFEQEALASASIAQVHAATLSDGKQVVVKVLRPKVKKQIKRDIKLMYLFAKILELCWPNGRRLKPTEVVAEFEKTIFDELDMQREAANASQLRRNFKDSNLLYVPEIYWSLVRHNILVLERIYGVPVSDITRLQENNTNLKILAEKGVEIFFTQVFRDCFFHADMHPGNVWVDNSNPKDPKYMALDFGIIGTLGPEDQYYLSENFLAFFKRDYRRVAVLHIESGWVPANTRVNDFEAAIRCVCEPIFEKPLSEISFGKTLLRLFQVAQRFNMEVQPQLILLQKTLISVEGLGRQLYPNLDLWNTAKPFLESWLKNRISPKALLHKFKENLPYWLDNLPEIPHFIYRAIQQQKTATITYAKTVDKQKTSFKDYFISFLMGGIFVAVSFASIMYLKPDFILRTIQQISSFKI